MLPCCVVAMLLKQRNMATPQQQNNYNSPKLLTKQYILMTKSKKDNPIITGIMGLLYAMPAVLILAILVTSCTNENLAFDVIESPVLATFEENIDSEEGILTMSATFYELDKSGILDKNIGIDSTLISGMTVEVFINENTSVGEVTTDSEGKAVFSKSFSELDGASRLEWVGTYSDTPFRIYRNF